MMKCVMSQERLRVGLKISIKGVRASWRDSLLLTAGGTLLFGFFTPYSLPKVVCRAAHPCQILLDV